MFIFIIIALLSMLIWVSNRGKRRNRIRQKAAYAGEAKALDLLEASGFSIEASQFRKSTGLWVNGEWVDTEVRVDFVGHRKGRPCVIEVKTGELAPNPRHGPTRRQLLEYSLLFPERDIYLLDMTEGLAHLIEFPHEIEGV